jgi:hypothetical protein
MMMTMIMMIIMGHECEKEMVWEGINERGKAERKGY